MVDHARKAVRAAAVADLTGLATTGTNVWSGRISPLRETEMPGLSVLVREETAEWDRLGAIVRTGRLIVVGTAQARDDDLLDLLDTIAAEVETAIYAEDSALDGVLQMIGPPTTQIEMPEPDDAAGKGALRRTGVVRILFPVEYRTELDDPTTIV